MFLVPFGKAHVDRARVDADLHAALSGGHVEVILPLVLLKRPRCVENQVVGFEDREGVVAVDGVIDRAARAGVVMQARRARLSSKESLQDGAEADEGAAAPLVGTTGGSTGSAGRRRRPGSQFGLQMGDPRFQVGQLFPGAGKHFTLDLEFLAGHQVQFGETAGKQCAGILLDVLGRTAGEKFETFAPMSSRIFGLAMIATS